MDLSEEQTQKMLKDPYCQQFIEAIAAILVHQSSRPLPAQADNQLEEEAEEAPIDGR